MAKIDVLYIIPLQFPFNYLLFLKSRAKFQDRGFACKLFNQMLFLFFLSLSQRDQRFYVNFCFDQIRHDNLNKKLIMSINIVNDQQKIKGTLSFMEESSNFQNNEIRN